MRHLQVSSDDVLVDNHVVGNNEPHHGCPTGC